MEAYNRGEFGLWEPEQHPMFVSSEQKRLNSAGSGGWTPDFTVLVEFC